MRPNILDPTYSHDKFGTKPLDILREFRGFIVSFDSDDDDDGDEIGDVLGVPHYVAHEIRRAYSAPESNHRPSKWFSDAALVEAGVAPNDASYAYSQSFRNQHPN